MKMQHAELIAYAAQHPDGWASLEWRKTQCNTQTVWRLGSDGVNPANYPKMDWRIKPATLKIDVEIPKPVEHSPLGYWLVIGNTSIRFASAEDRDGAERILIAALRGTS